MNAGAKTGAKESSKISSLDHIQDFVVSSITRDASLLEDEERARACRDVTTGNARLSPEAQLDIYREQFWLRHVGALEEDFESIAKLLGNDAFHALCVEYIKTHPPTSFTLRDLGDRFAAFVAAHATYGSDVLVGDLARVEWAFVESFDAPDAPPLDPHKVAAMPEDAWPHATITIHPAVRLLSLATPAHDFRVAARKAETCDHGDLAEPLARPEMKDTFVVIFRAPDALKYIDIEREAFVLLQKLARGLALGVACEETVNELALDEATFEGNVGAWFQSWSAWGWIIDLNS